jgi:hypothetical protein
MLKFGSRTELYFDNDFEVDWKVKVGDRVKGGGSIIAVVRVREQSTPRPRDAAAATK